MDKSELRKHIKDKFKSMGYQSIKSSHYKIYDDDYLIGFVSEPSIYCRGYCFTCGIIYLPDEKMMPFRGVFDFQWDFIFPWEPDDNPDVKACLERKLFRRDFEYNKYTMEQLERIFESNYDYFMKPLLDKEYGLSLFRNNWKRMKYKSVSKIRMICKRAGMDENEVLTFLKKTAEENLCEIESGI